MHSTSLLGLLKEFRGQNLQNFVPSALAYAFSRMPYFSKRELCLWPNVKSTQWVRRIQKRNLELGFFCPS